VEILEQAIKQLEKQDGAVWILVPDRFTLQCEKLLLELSPALLNIRVVTFSMLYNILKDELDFHSEILDKTSSVLFVWRAIRNVHNNLVWFNRIKSYSLAEKVYNTLNQLTSSMVNFEALEQKARGEVTKKKMHDLVLIYKEYKRLTKEFTDSSGMLGYLIENLYKSKLIKDVHMFVVGFDHFSIQREAVLEKLKILVRSFTIHNTTCNPRILPMLTWQNDSVWAEAARIANRVSLLTKQGVKYKDIVIVLCDYQNTYKIFESALGACNIPVNLELGIAISENIYVRWIRDVLAYKTYKQSEDFVAVKQGVTIDEMAREKLNGMLDTIVNVMGEEKITREEFLDVFETLTRATKLSAPPIYVDRVLLIDSKDYQPSPVPYLFVCGAKDGAFPTIQDDTDIITELDVANLKIKIDPTPKIQNQRLYNHSMQILGSCIKELVVSYSGEPSELIENNPVDFDDEVASPWYATRQMLLNNDSVLFNALDKPSFLIDVKEENIRTDFDFIKVTQLETFMSCPYLHFLQHVLEVRPRKAGREVIGIILHRFAEEVVRDWMNGHERDNLLEIAVGKEKLEQVIYEGLKQECILIKKRILEEIKNSDFKPKYLEKRFDVDGFVGKADRVDVDTQNRARVIDYKTGATKSKLQLQLYLSFLINQGYGDGGAYYFPLAGGLNKKTELIPAKGTWGETVEIANEIRTKIKQGVIIRNADKNTCCFCMGRTMCPVRGDI